MKNINFFCSGNFIYIILIILIIILLYYLNKKYKFEVDKKIFIFDLVLIFILILYFFKPGIKLETSFLSKKKIILLIDKSLSSIKRKEIRRLIDSQTDLIKNIKSRGFDTIKYSFGSIIQKEPVVISDYLKSDTRIKNALNNIHKKYGNKISAVLLITDGNFELIRKSEDIPYKVYPILPKNIEYKKRGIYTVKLKSIKPLKKGVLSVFKVFYSTFRNDDIIDFYIDGNFYKSKFIKRGYGKVIFKYKPDQDGEIAIGAFFRKQNGDNFSLDDKKTIIKKIERNRKKIVLLYGELNPEIRFIKDFLRESENYKIVYNGRINDINNQKITETDLLILVAPGNRRFNRKVYGQIKKRIKNGMGFIYLNGEVNSDVLNFKDILPFYLTRKNKVMQTDQEIILTKKGMRDGLMMYIPGLIKGESTGSIEYYNPGLIPKDTSKVIAKIGLSPVIMFQKKGKGKIFSINVGPIWKWDFINLAFGLKTKFFQNFWTYLIEETIKSEQKEYVIKLYEKRLLPEESFKIKVLSKRKNNKNHLKIKIRNIYSKKIIKTCKLNKNMSNIYSGIIKIKKFGCYELIIEENKKIINLQKKIIVAPRMYEYKNIFINKSRLKDIAIKSGGKLIKNLDLKNLKLDKTKVNNYKEVRFYFLNNWFTLILINLCFLFTIYRRWARLE